MKNLINMLIDDDYRSIGHADEVARVAVAEETVFDELVELMASENKLIAMRASDAAEKVSRRNSEYLRKHKDFLMELLQTELRQEVYWHLAMMLPRLPLTLTEATSLFDLFEDLFAEDKSRIVRVCSLQALYELSLGHSSLINRFGPIHAIAMASPQPSVSARARIITRDMVKRGKL